ncbi:hypothetical protein SAY86_011250 [Trapa natans]|uniref:Uncharacterized protein n=1 Tax=Trapa natans TaxID=22666 RepID=A0AAN7LWP2_TRANT|nr:hypothetical protein SAY86_011250 [Trapa natans]
MGFFSFLGRVLFAAFFILSAWQTYNEFGVDGGPAAQELKPKLKVALLHISSKFGIAAPEVDIKRVVATITALKGFGGLLFVFGSSFGAYLLVSLYSPDLFSLFLHYWWPIGSENLANFPLYLASATGYYNSDPL